MTDYQATIKYLFEQLPMFSVSPGAYKPGLDTAHILDDAFGNGHRKYKVIHVAGTNGKGSTSNMLASVLAEAGFKVGLYTSPHIFDFRERIRVNGEKIPEEAVVDFVDRYRKMDLPCAPSFFELTTIMAFEYFAKCGVDIAVIETGLGGRLDTTNIVTPILSVITNVSLDHTAQLGNTLASIAAEKAGIIKPGVPVVIGEASGDVREVFTDTAMKAGSSICFAQDSPVRVDMDSTPLRYSFSENGEFEIVTDLQGEFQRENVNTVLHALSILGIADKESVIRGMGNVMKNTGLMGRWTEKSVDGHKVIVDTGHNIGAWVRLAPQLSELSRSHKLHMVIGFVADKDIEEVFALLPKDAVYYFVAPSTKRRRPSSDLLELGKKHGLTGKAYDTVEDGLHAALSEAAVEEPVFLGGSNYVVADAETILNTDDFIVIDGEFADATEELLELAIYNISGNLLYHQYFKPARARKWGLVPHNISPAFVKDKPHFRDCLPQIQRIFDRAKWIGGFAVSNDIRHLEEEGVASLHLKEVADARELFWLCTSEHTGKGLDATPGLAKCIEYLGMEFPEDERHTASGDTLMTQRLLVSLIDKVRLAHPSTAHLSQQGVCRFAAKAVADEREHLARGFVAIHRKNGRYYIKGTASKPEDDDIELLLELPDWKKGAYQIEHEQVERQCRAFPDGSYDIPPKVMKKLAKYSNTYDPISNEYYRKLIRLGKRSRHDSGRQ